MDAEEKIFEQYFMLFQHVQLQGKEQNNIYLLLREVVVRSEKKRNKTTKHLEIANLCQGSSANNNNIMWKSVQMLLWSFPPDK